MKLTREEVILLAEHGMSDIRKGTAGSFGTRTKDGKAGFNKRSAEIVDLALTKLLLAVDGPIGQAIELGDNPFLDLLEEPRTIAQSKRNRAKATAAVKSR